MPAAELAVWREFARCEPIGTERLDWQAATVASTVAAAAGARCKAGDFVPDYDAAWKPKATAAETEANIDAWMTAYGGSKTPCPPDPSATSR